MSEIYTVGLDLAKNVFQVHGADAAGRAVLRQKLRRDHVLAFFRRLPACVLAMEACGGGHFWGREISKLGHEARLTEVLRLTCADSAGLILPNALRVASGLRTGERGIGTVRRLVRRMVLTGPANAPT